MKTSITIIIWINAPISYMINEKYSNFALLVDSFI